MCLNLFKQYATFQISVKFHNYKTYTLILPISNFFFQSMKSKNNAYFKKHFFQAAATLRRNIVYRVEQKHFHTP